MIENDVAYIFKNREDIISAVCALKFIGMPINIDMEYHEQLAGLHYYVSEKACTVFTKDSLFSSEIRRGLIKKTYTELGDFIEEIHNK